MRRQRLCTLLSSQVLQAVIADVRLQGTGCAGTQPEAGQLCSPSRPGDCGSFQQAQDRGGQAAAVIAAQQDIGIISCGGAAHR